jgi:flagella basal body P-ring formation protein FlgA
VLEVLILLGSAWGQLDGIQIYLLREAVLDTDTISVGQVGIVRGDTALAARIQPIGLGRFTVPGQQILLDRQTIVSRIVSSGIDPASLRISGSESVVLRRNGEQVPVERLVQVAEIFLKSQMPIPIRIHLIRPPKPLSLGPTQVPGDLKPRLSGPIKNGLARVNVEAISNGHVVGQQDLLFGVKYSRRRAVAVDDLPAGIVLNETNIKIETLEAGEPEPDQWTVPFGMVTRQRISKGQEIEMERTVPIESPVLIKRRQSVVVKLETSRLSLSSLGEAQAEGKVGDYIPVKMGITRDARVIKGKILPDGTVEPYYEGVKS